MSLSIVMQESYITDMKTPCKIYLIVYFPFKFHACGFICRNMHNFLPEKWRCRICRMLSAWEQLTSVKPEFTYLGAGGRRRPPKLQKQMKSLSLDCAEPPPITNTIRSSESSEQSLSKWTLQFCTYWVYSICNKRHCYKFCLLGPPYSNALFYH